MQLQTMKRLPGTSVEATQSAWRTLGDPPPAAGGSTEGDIAVRELALGEHARALFDVPRAHLGGLMADANALRVTVRLEDDKAGRNKPTFEMSWRQWLRVWNVLQALPGAVLTTRAAILAGTMPLAELDASVRIAPPAAMPVVSDDARLIAVREVNDRDAVKVLERLLAAHPSLAAPDVPLELRPPAFEVDGDLEFGWPTKKVAAYFDAQRTVADALVVHGWTVFSIERGIPLADLERALGVG
jgi:DEAD/DEAH box helicase domain-containing protein